jgi:RHS repeat-associated protein
MNDNDVKGGLGNQQDYGMRIYDPRVGRFLSVDPITKSYPELTPYQYASNRPIWAVDLDGLESALMGPGMTHNTAGRALGEYLNEPAPLWMKRTLAAQANYESRGVELTEDDYEGTTRGGFYLLSAGFSLSRWAQSNPGTLKIPNTRRVPQHPDVEVPANTTKPKQGVTVSEDVPIVTNKQATAANNGKATVDPKTAKISSSSNDPIAPFGNAKSVVADGYTRVGRWMSKKEFEVMKSTNQVQEGAGGQTFVSVLGYQDYMPQAKPGTVYVEFDVPTNSLVPGGEDGWYKLLAPSAKPSQQYMLKKQGGEHLPKVKNLTDILHNK